jgi:hypothetical protein
MLRFPRTLAKVAVILTIVTAASFSTNAQELKDRQLQWAHDYSTIQMPIEIVSMTLNGKEVRPGEKIKGDKNWVKGLTFKIKNISDQPISYLNVHFEFPMPNGFVSAAVLHYGAHSSHNPMTGPPPPSIKPGETKELVLKKENYDSLLYVLEQAKVSSDFDTAPFYIERVCFENQPDIIWQGGWLKRRNAVEHYRFDRIQKYFLPVKEK